MPCVGCDAKSISKQSAFLLGMPVDLIKENDFTFKKGKKQNIPQKQWQVDYTDDLALLTNTPTLAEFLLCSLEQEVIGLYVNANKTKFKCFKQKGAISTLSDKPLKLINQFKYLVSNISSTESNINIHIEKLWTAIKRI